MKIITRFFERLYHLWKRILLESKRFPERLKVYGLKVAAITFVDGLIPPGKSSIYINTISQYVNLYMVKNVKVQMDEPKDCRAVDLKKKIWCCWWQGIDNMPEVVRLCHDRLKQIVPEDKAELVVITLENYQDYVQLPDYIIKKYEDGIITMTTLSDVLRFELLNKYGGYWLDATVFFTGDIPKEYFEKSFYCQKMEGTLWAKREACQSKWCGFSMAGDAGNPVFQYMVNAFSAWWKDYDSIIDYVLIDYLLHSGYELVPKIRNIIDAVPNNNEDIFEMYQVLNMPYSKDLYSKLTRRNVMHKLTYKMDLQKYTETGSLTLYGYLFEMVYGEGE